MRGASATSGAQKLVTRPIGRPEEVATGGGGAQRAGTAYAAIPMPDGRAGPLWPRSFSLLAGRGAPAGHQSRAGRDPRDPGKLSFTSWLA